jgi:uncharacterized protein YjbI with pentapeptide repeats
MANPEHLAKLIEETARNWNKWRKQEPGIKADLSGANLSRANLRETDLSNSNLRGTNLSEADLIDSDMSGADLAGASLVWAKLYRVNLFGADLSRANLVRALLSDADLSEALLNDADISEANLSQAIMRGAELCNAKIYDTDLRTADLREANLSGADLNRADLVHANLSGASLRSANLRAANLREANLRGADLRGGNFRSANLQSACLDQCEATDIQLWETQRAGWSIVGIQCNRAFWDKKAEEPTEYEPGEFERLYSDQVCIELFYQGGVSTFELNTLPALLHHLASLHPGNSIRLKSIEETGGGARISISVSDADPEATEKIRADATLVYKSQLALRDNEILRLDTEKRYLESFVSEKLIKAMLSAAAPQNVFNAPVYGAALPSGNARVEFHQTINNNSEILALLEQIMTHSAELALARADATQLQAELESTKAELTKSNPDKSIVAKGAEMIRTIAGGALKAAAGKLGERAASGDWQAWLHQLGQFVHQLK